MTTRKRSGATGKVFLLVVIWLLLLVILHSSGVRIMMVRGSSMKPTFHDRELVIGFIIKDILHLERGDVATFYPIASSPNIYIKRIVGLPDDILEARSDLLFVNGVSEGISRTGTGTWGPITVPPNAVFVMGDNRAVSIDSRTIGCIPLQQICAKVIGKSVPMP